MASPARVPDVNAPTLRESGVALDLSNWRGVVAPPGLSAADTSALTAQVRALVGSPAWKDTLARTGWSDLYLDGPAFRQFLLAEEARVEAVLRRLDSGRATTSTGWTPSPRVAPVAALILAALFAVLHLRQRHLAAPPALTRPQLQRVGAITAAYVAHAALAPVVGFIPTAAALFAAGAFALGSARVRIDVALGLAVAAAIALLFALGLDVPLPMGAVAR